MKLGHINLPVSLFSFNVSLANLDTFHTQTTFKIGLSVSKKLGGAVARNRAKRLIRAGFDVVKPNVRTGNLIVIGARAAILKNKSYDVAKELKDAFITLGLYCDNNG